MKDSWFAFETMSYSRKRKLCNNTYLEHDGHKVFYIKLHGTAVVTYKSIDEIILNTGGYYTYTTKDRINRFSPARVHSEKCIWYIFQGNDKYEFYDGIVVDKNGTPIDAKPYINQNKSKRKLDKMVNEYIKGYIQSMMDSKSFPLPTNGDCWGCLMRPEEEKKYDIVNQPMGFDHFIEHFKEKYYVPSIATNAISIRGNPGFIYQYEKSNIEKGIWPNILERDMRYMFRRIKLNLLNEIKE